MNTQHTPRAGGGALRTRASFEASATSTGFLRRLSPAALSIPLLVALALQPAAAQRILFREACDSSNFTARGWYDNDRLTVTAAEHIPGSAASLEFHFLKGATTPTSGGAVRRLFTPSDSVYVRYWVKYSAGWEGSNRPYHPHEFHLITSVDDRYIGPAATHLTAYIEQNEGRPMLAIQDALNIDTARIGQDLRLITEQRSLAGCNGSSDRYPAGDCYRAGTDYRNGKAWQAPRVCFTDSAGAFYKNDWHLVEAVFKLNTIAAGKGIADGVVRYWFDGTLMIDAPDVMLRTAGHAGMQFNQFLIAPYIGDGSPVDQTMWVDEITVADSRPNPLSLEILGVPDTAASFDSLTFRVRYGTDHRDLCLNITVSGYPVDSLPRNFSQWVNGTGELTCYHRVPNARRVAAFYVSAYLTNNGRWSGNELFTSTYDRRTIVLPADLAPDWELTAPPSVTVEQPFSTTCRYDLAGLQRKSIPNLVVDLTAPDGTVVARQIEWSVPARAAYTHRWMLPATVNVAALRLRARLEDERLDATQAPLASAEGSAFAVLGAVAPDFGRVELRGDSLFIDKAPAFLHGVNVFSFWNAWDESTIRRELGKMHDARLDFARVYLDWAIYEPRRGEWNPDYQRRIAALIRAADSLDIWLELVPVGNWGGWIYDLYSNHWWTCPESRAANETYFAEFGRWLDSLQAGNIYYVSVMQEGSWNFDWFDPLNGEFPKPGTGARAEADTDWAAWLAQRGETYRSFEDASPELFGRWAGERFADLLSLRATAFRRGSRYRYAVGAEGTGSGCQYDRRLLGKHATYYTLPELWAHTVDCLEIHCYTPVAGSGYWSGSTGLRSYRAWTSDFRKPVHAGEVNWNYVDTASLNMAADSTWRKLREKLELVRQCGYTGYGVWAWMDYDARRLGFLDRNFQSRPILDSLARWIEGMQTSVTSAGATPEFTLDVSPNPVGPASPSHAATATVHVHGNHAATAGSGPSRQRLRIRVLDFLGREVARLFDGEMPSGRLERSFDASRLQSGWYCVLAEDGSTQLRKTMIVIR